MIRFGTSGWRAVIAEEFTFENVRKVVHAIAQHLVAERGEGPVVVGYDTRFLSPDLAKMTAEIVASHGLPVLLSNDPVPTPVVSFQILHQKAAGGINFTASHNPAEYNGIKFNMANGAPASPEVTKEIERLANGPTPSSPGLAAPVRTFNPRPAYLAKLKKIIDVSALKKAKLKVAADVLYGTGRGYLDTLLLES